MALELKLAGDPAYKRKAEPVPFPLSDETKATVAELLRALHDFNALGIAAPMFGIPLTIILVHLNDSPVAMLNPAIVEASAETQEVEEGSLPFPGVSTPVTRSREITVRYTDVTGTEQTRTLQGIEAACIQHEMDYLEGRTFLDNLTRLKRDMLLRKAQKHIRAGHIPHVHSEFCSH